MRWIASSRGMLRCSDWLEEGGFKEGRIVKLVFILLPLYSDHFNLSTILSSVILLSSAHSLLPHDAQFTPKRYPTNITPTLFILPHHTTPHHTTPHHTTPHQATPRHTTPHHTTPHHTTPRHTTPRHTTPHHTTPRHTTPRHTTPHHTTPHHTTPHHTPPHHTTPLDCLCKFDLLIKD